MAQHNRPMSEVPRVLYTFITEDDETKALVIDRDLDDLAYWFGAEEALLLPGTPTAVRTLLFNNLVSRNVREGYKLYANAVQMHTTNDGMSFLEVKLTLEGYQFVTNKLRAMQSAQKKIVYSTMQVAADKLFDSFTPELKAALLKLGLRPA